MEKIIIASLRKNAGKTSLVVGIAKAAKKRFAYFKPFGERMLYRKKRLWDYDSSLITGIFGLKDDPVDMSIGFDHSKLRYMYDEEGTRQKLHEIISRVGGQPEILFIEGGRDLTYGISVNLDTVSLAKYTGGKLYLVVSGESDVILDDLLFLKNHIRTEGVRVEGVIINKVQNLEEFKATHLPVIEKTGIRVLGIVPFRSELTYFTVSYLADHLFAKVLCGEGGLQHVVKNILIGAWSANVFLQNPVFKKENKLVITGGDRTDMILASLESDTSAIILTNNILPPSNIISRASEKNIPLLMVFSDTYQTAKQIENLEPLLTRDDQNKVDLLEEMVRSHVHVGEIVGG
ncbi:MAG TPA: DRTGG domain-containing protein [Thermodesulfobacteriota bacterium]|nr:DRTGG domain-containing protein [Thermodesulfobacteriota bacterium]